MHTTSALVAALADSEAALGRKLSAIEPLGHTSVQFKQTMQFELFTLP